MRLFPNARASIRRMTADTIGITDLWLPVNPSSTAIQATGQTGQAASAAAESHQRQGIFYFKRRNLQKALGEFRAAVALNPNDAISHDYIGMILGESG